MSRPNPLGLNDEQLQALQAHIRLVEAGPGSGKTRTVVARLRQNIERGMTIAMLSFTNAAVDVARLRCRDVPQLTEPPNFVGTFDLFFRRYVITPAVTSVTGRPPTYVSSWDDLRPSMAVVRPPGGGSGIRLTRFTQQGDEWLIDESKLARAERQLWENLSEWSRQSMNDQGAQRIQGLQKAHVYDTGAARRHALSLLDNSLTSPLPDLARRFNEIIIDEFQDCDEIEHQLIAQLSTAGIDIVAVGDPDQAIYEFRQTNPELYQRFRDSTAPESRATLGTCFRSTPAICSVIKSLRSVGLGEIEPSPLHPGGAETIHIVVGSGIKAGARAYKLANQRGISPLRTRVIAHRRSDARSLLRAGNQPPRGTSQIEPLLVALADLRSGAQSSHRLQAIRKVEAFVLNQFAWPDEPPAEGRVEQLSLLDVTAQELRVVASSILQSSRTWDDAASCKAEVRRIIEQFAGETSIELIPRLASRLTVPEKVWRFWESRTTSALSELPADTLRWAHVHGVKGDEFEAIIFVLPTGSPAQGQSHVLDDWQNGINSEQRRVLYVGVSRAERLLVLVVSPSRRNQLESILQTSAIDYTVSVVR